jgi:hypothetical protein
MSRDEFNKKTLRPRILNEQVHLVLRDIVHLAHRKFWTDAVHNSPKLYLLRILNDVRAGLVGQLV